MTRMEELYNLVQTLTKAEKRMFRISMDRRSGSQAMQLFDCLVKSTSFNEEILGQELDRLGLNRQLTSLVNRLRKMIIQSLSPVLNSTLIRSRLRHALWEIELLFQKELMEQIPSRIKKARQLAVDHSRLVEVLQILEWERRLVAEYQPRKIQEVYKRLRREENQILETLLLQRKAIDIYMRMKSLILEAPRPVLEAEHARYEEIMAEPDLTRALASGDFLTVAYAKQAVGQYWMARLSYDEAILNYTALIDLWKANTAQIGEETPLFLASFNNLQLSIIGADHKDFSIPDSYARFFTRESLLEPDAKIRFQNTYYGSKLLFYLNRALFQEGWETSHEIIDWLDSHEKLIPQSTWLSLQHNLAVFFFLADHAADAGRRVQAILNAAKGDQHKDIRDFALLFQLILYEELGGNDLIEYKLRSVKRVFSKANRLNAMAQPLLKYFTIEKRYGPKEKVERLQRFLGKIESPILGLMEVKLWLETKISGGSITDHFKEFLKSL